MIGAGHANQGAEAPRFVVDLLVVRCDDHVC
jgi:hypothetical protein